jgi:hypothetical protein
MNTLDPMDNEAQAAELIAYVHANSTIIEREAGEARIPASNLELQLLLYLPRLVEDGRWPDAEAFAAEARRLCRLMRPLIEPYADWLEPPSDAPKSPRDAVFAGVDEAEARIVLERFHYLASFRKNSQHFGLRTPVANRQVSLITVSPFDLFNIADKVPGIRDPGTEIAVVSRFYSFDWAPRNATSYLMGRTNAWLKANRPTVKVLVTYVNPNMGFSAASFKASNWLHFGREWGTRYAYLDGRYTTDRELVHHFGVADPAVLRDRLGARFETSNMRLAPLSLYVYYLDEHLSDQQAADTDYYFQRS